MIDVTESFIFDFIDKLDTMFDVEQIREIREALIITLYKYQVTNKSTELVEYKQNEDAKIYNMFFSIKKVEGLSKRTLYAYKATIDMFFSIVPKAIKEVTANDIRYFLAIKSTTCTARGLNNYRRNVSAFFSFLATEGYIAVNPMLKVKKIKEEKKVKRGFSDEELELLRDNCQDIREEAIFEFLYSTGCRVGEVVKANVEDVDFNKNEVLVTGKGNKQRIVYLNPRAKMKLQSYLRGRTRGPLFLSVIRCGRNEDEKNQHEGYKRLETSGLEILIRKLGKRAGVENTHPHRMRRTTATKALRRGMSIDEVQKMLGHESVDTTAIYANTDIADVKRKHEKFI